MTTSPNPIFLRRVLLLDAVATGATALLAVALAGPLAGWLGLPVGLLRGAGLILIPFEADMDPLFTMPERQDALIDEEYDWIAIKIGVNYVD